MPFSGSYCKQCSEEHGIPIGWDTLGEHDCPKCGAKDGVEIEWETEYDLEPIED